MASQPQRASFIRRKPVPHTGSVSTVDDTFSSIDSRSQTESPVPRDPTPPQTQHPTGVPVPGSPSPPPADEPTRFSPPESPSPLASEPPSPRTRTRTAAPEPAEESKPLPPPPPVAVTSPPEADAPRPESPVMAATSVRRLADTAPFPPPKPPTLVTQYPRSMLLDEPMSAPPADVRGPAKLGKGSPDPQQRRRGSSFRSSPPLKREDTPPSERSSRLIRSDERRARSASAQPLSSRSSVSSRVMSQAVEVIRASDPKQTIKNQLPAKKVEKLRRTLLLPSGGGSRPRAKSLEQSIPGLEAWVINPDNTKAEYNTSLLVNAEKVPELWNDTGNLTICLRSPDSGAGPSFKIPYPAIASSLILVELIQDVNSPGGFRYRPPRGYDNLGVDDPARPSSYVSSASHSGSESPGEYSLHIPPPLPEDAGPSALPSLDRLVAIRNLFAFLTGQPLVATKTQSNAFAVFLQVAALLEEFAFASPDGSSFGTEVDLSFGFYIRQLGLGDVRNSREKTIQGLLIAERMRSVDLYNEVFAHGVGKFPALVNLHSPTWGKVSSLTRQRLDRAHLDLLNRQHNVNVRIEQFDFPSIFAGIANSTSSTEFRAVRFKQWRNSFSKMRSFTMGYYKHVFGSWPPKASSRKNPFTESGLNRLVLKTLYSDMCTLYDLLADRKSLTSRVINKTAEETESASNANPVVTAVRRMLSEFDNSSPPVLPPIPFDVPKIPTMSSISASYGRLQPKEQTRFDRGIKGHELKLVLEKSYDYNTNTAYANNQFLQKFKEFEAKEARGKVGADIADQRIGYWLFLYVVLQSLPILVMDAPGLMHTDDVEYFLCQPTAGSQPGAEDVSQVRKMWYEVSGGAGYVELAADAVLFSVEAIHHRSHCWLQAKMWEAAIHEEGDDQMPMSDVPHDGRPATAVPSGLDSGAGTPSTLSLDTAPSPALGPSPVIRPRNQSPGPLQAPMRAMNQNHRSSVVLGIEPVFDLPEGLTVPGERSSRVFSHSPSHDRSSSLGPSPLGDLYKHRSVSVGNLSALATVQSAAGSSEGGLSQPGATFDDILGKSNKKEKKRKSFFFA